MEGKIISKEKLQIQDGAFQLSIADLKSGIYLMVIEDVSGEILHKQNIVKVK